MSEFKRFFAQIDGNFAIIDGDEYKHAASVMRVFKGENIICINNTDFEYLCQIESIAKSQITAKVLEKRQTKTENKYEIILICGFLKGDKSELIVQKATELGVNKIVVFESLYKAAYLSQSKLQRLERVAKEAAKQCGRTKAPQIFGENSLEKALKYGENCQTKLFACEFADKSDIDLSGTLGSTALVCGSEGGFSKDEFELANKIGYSTISLGERILRAETAAIALCTVTAFLNGDLKKGEQLRAINGKAQTT